MAWQMRAHALLLLLLQGMLAGGQTHFTRAPDMTTFFDDLALVRPTEGLFPPRITSMLHDRFQARPIPHS